MRPRKRMTTVAARIEPQRRGCITHPQRVYGTAVSGAALRIFMPADGRVTGLLIAGQHGDEPETTVLLSTALRSVSELTCAVVTAVNPDGLTLGTRGNLRGVDLNRNCPAANWQPAPVYYPWYTGEVNEVELSPGEAPGSEPETRALISLIEELDPDWIVSLHSRLACVDDPLATPMAHWLAEQSGLPLVTDIGYPTPGSLGSWALERERLLITFELPDLSIVAVRRRLSMLLEILLGDGQPTAAAP